MKIFLCASPKRASGIIGVASWLHTIDALSLASWLPAIRVAKLVIDSVVALIEYANAPSEEWLYKLVWDVMHGRERADILIKRIAALTATIALLVLNALFFVEAAPLLLLQVGSIMNFAYYMRYCFDERVKVFKAQEMFDGE